MANPDYPNADHASHRSWEPYDEQLSAPPKEHFFDLDGLQRERAEYEFTLDRRRLIGDGITEVTPNSLLRYSLQLLQSTCGPQIEQYRDIADANHRDVQLDRAKRYLNGMITIGEGLKVKRSAIADYSRALSNATTHLELTNDPLSQLLSQISTECGEEMRPGMLQILTGNLVTVTHWPLLKAEIDQQINLEKARRAALTA